MAKSILRDKNRLVPCAAYLDGEYGEKGIFVGVPAILGEEGVIKVVEVDLSDDDRKGFDKSVAAVKELVGEVDELLS
jgi:malate dehydrogenase